MKSVFSLYTVLLPLYFVYMLQQVDYSPKKFMQWLQHVFYKNMNIAEVMQRKELHYTPNAKVLLAGLYSSSLLIVFVPLLLFNSVLYVLLSIFVIIVATPVIMILFATFLTFFARILFVAPKQREMIKQSKKVFLNHKGIKIAVLGSYGKTSMKEMLATLLSIERNVAITPGNMNTAVSHARFSQKLRGDEDVLIVEFGEGAPGDIALMTETLQPDYAIITGLAPNHLDLYFSVDAVAEDLLSIYEHVDSKNVFASDESELLRNYLPNEATTFNNNEVLGWIISDITISITSTSFTMKKGSEKLTISTGLIGRHQVAPIALAVAVAYLMGLDKKHILDQCLKIRPYEHRMQPRSLHGAWVIDDTYNGNIEGMKAGLNLLSELDMKRKWYVTPGLVDQGDENNNVHAELGRIIAVTQPDIVVLMDNSVRPIIQKSMESNGFKGELRIEKNPLEFYKNIEHMIISGDLVMMQNDWTDNYN